MTKVIIIETDIDCLHCILHACTKSFIQEHPEKGKDHVLSCLIQVTAEFIAWTAQNQDELKGATESFIAQIPNAMAAALASFPTANPGRPS